MTCLKNLFPSDQIAIAIKYTTIYVMFEKSVLIRSPKLSNYERYMTAVNSDLPVTSGIPQVVYNAVTLTPNYL
jgi:hypothetical protein